MTIQEARQRREYQAKKEAPCVPGSYTSQSLQKQINSLAINAVKKGQTVTGTEREAVGFIAQQAVISLASQYGIESVECDLFDMITGNTTNVELKDKLDTVGIDPRQALCVLFKTYPYCESLKEMEHDLKEIGVI